MAGIISLLNDYRISQGMIPLGFLNPWLYHIASGGLNDIIYGENPGCGTIGFPATEGWDPVRISRLGVSSFSTLADSALYRLQVSGRPTFKHWRI